MVPSAIGALACPWASSWPFRWVLKGSASGSAFAQGSPSSPCSWSRAGSGVSGCCLSRRKRQPLRLLYRREACYGEYEDRNPPHGGTEPLMLSRLFLTGAIVALALSSAGAQPAYLDDRSNPVMLIRSLYNAINRKEYARAYAYSEEPPAPTLAEYAAGYADTEHVEVVTGTATSEGAAGSIFYSLPVALEARGTDGEHRMYSGCYTFRFIQPAAQTTPYRPLSIVRGEMQEGEPAEGNLEDLLPPSCGDGEPVSVDPLLQKAERIFE